MAASYSLEAIVSRLEAIASRLEAIATRLEAIAISLKQSQDVFVGLVFRA